MFAFTLSSRCRKSPRIRVERADVDVVTARRGVDGRQVEILLGVVARLHAVVGERGRRLGKDLLRDPAIPNPVRRAWRLGPIRVDPHAELVLRAVELRLPGRLTPRRVRRRGLGLERAQVGVGCQCETRPTHPTTRKRASAIKVWLSLSVIAFLI